MKQVFKLVNLFLVILLVSFTSCTNDLSEKDSQMSFSFTLPQEKLNRTTDDNNDKTLWNVTAVIENKKDIIQKIEQSGYSGETVTITFNQIIIGQKVRINIDLTQDGETTPSYTGSSDWLIVKKDENKINIALSKVEIILPVDAALPKINTSPESIVEIATSGSTETITKPLSVNATSTDGGTLSFIWQEKNENNEWTPYTPITTTTDNDNTTCSIDITVNKGQDRTFRCIITNTNNSVNGNKTATIETNEVTVAYVEGALTSITAQYTGESETFGSRPYSSVKVTETYTSGSKTTDVTVPADASRYTISPTKDDEKAIGYVPYTVKYNPGNGNIKTEIRVPVKYELNANDFIIKSNTNNDENIGYSKDSPEKIPEHTYKTKVTLTAKDSLPNVIYKTEESEQASEYDIIGNGISYHWIYRSVNDTNNVNNANTLTPISNSWCIGEEITLYYYVQFCPWKIALKTSDGNLVEDLNNLTENTTYILSATNEADENPNVTFISDSSVFRVSGSTLTTPSATTSDQTAIITANVGGIEIGKLNVTVPGNPEYDAIVSDWYSLKTKIENIPENTYTEDNPYVIAISSNIIQTTYCIDVTQPVKIIPLNDVTISRTTTHKTQFFYTTAYFEIAGTPNAKITLDGDTIQATNPIIQATSSLSISYCDFNKNINISGYGGAIYVNKDDTSTINVNLSNCNFDNNTVTSTVNGGAVALYGKSIISKINNCTFTNNKATNGSGGALYIYGTTLQTTDKIHTLKDCIFSNNQTSSESGKGGALYLERGTLILDGITMTRNIDYQNNNSDIFVYNDYCYVTLENENTIDCFIDQFGSGTDNPVIKLGENFNTDSRINFLCVVSDGASVEDGDRLITPTTQLTDEQIACFPSITDEEGTSWTLNSDGTITAATSGGSGGTQLSGTSVTSETQLLDALSGTAEIIIIENDITLTGSNSLVINNRTVQIAANKNVKITQTQTNSDYNLIWVQSGGNLTLGGGAGMLTLQGNSTATGPLIYMNGNELTLTENCKLTGVSNNTAANAILILKGEFNMTGGEITENTAGSAINTNKNSQTGNITMNISGGKIYNNSGASNGGAINIVNASYSTTVNIYGTAEIYNNTTKGNGGSIYMTGSNNILNVNPSTENDKVRIYDNYQDDTNQNASIYITNGSTFYLNGNNLTRNLTPYSSNINKP